MRQIMGKAMDDSGILSLQDYWKIIRRRMAVVLLVAMAVSVIAYIVVKRMPNVYRAETMILVDPQQVPNNYVPSTVSSSVSDRLTTIQQEVTSPSRLKRVIDSMNLFPEQRKKRNEQEIIAGMQKAITVQVVEQGGRGLSAFRVGFTGRDPVEVAAIANRLAEMFISENLKARERQSYGTAEFLDDELKRTKEELDAKQAELDQVKSKYMLDLPESKQYHLEALTTLRGQLQASEDRVNQAQQQKVYLQSMAVTQAPTVDLDPGAGIESPWGQQIQKIEGQLSTLRARYGDNYPEVRKYEAELQDLKAKQKAALADEGSTTRAPVIRQAPSSRGNTVKNPVLAAQMDKLDDQVAKENAQQQQLQQQIAFHVSKLERIPAFEQRISRMMMDYDSLRKHYADLQSKKLSADMASALETREKGERFVVLDRALVPTHPFAPKRALMMLLGMLAGLAAGIGLAVALEMAQGALYSKSEVAGLLGDTPILADIPRIHAPGETFGQRLRLGGAFLATAVGSVLVGLAISYWTNGA